MDIYQVVRVKAKPPCSVVQTPHNVQIRKAWDNTSELSRHETAGNICFAGSLGASFIKVLLGGRWPWARCEYLQLKGVESILQNKKRLTQYQLCHSNTRCVWLCTVRESDSNRPLCLDLIYPHFTKAATCPSERPNIWTLNIPETWQFL